MRSCSLAGVVGVVLAGLAGQSAFGLGQITNLGTLGGHSYGVAVSNDGTVVAGHSNLEPSGLSRAFRWTQAGGMQTLGSTPTGSAAYTRGMNADGSVIAVGGGVLGHFWTLGSGFSSVGTLGGSASNVSGVSADGSVLVGDALNSADVGHAFRWTSAGGMQDLGTLGGVRSYALGVSGNGQAVVGISDVVGFGDRAFRWTPRFGMENLGTFGGDFSRANAVSQNGFAVVGSAHLPGNSDYHAFRWTQSGGMQDLGALGGTRSWSSAVSADGSVIVGMGTLPGNAVEHAFLWTSSLGIVDLNTYLPSIGIDITGWTLREAKGISADGTCITGYGWIDGGYRAWVVTGVPSPSGVSVLAVAGVIAIRRKRSR